MMTSKMMKLDIQWESYPADGVKRSRPPASTVHGWLTKMRGTLLDNEKMRHIGIKEMKEAKSKRSSIKKRNAARMAAGRSPIRASAKPFLHLSFLRARPANSPKSPIKSSRRPTPAVRQRTSSSTARTRRPGPRPHQSSNSSKSKTSQKKPTHSSSSRSTPTTRPTQKRSTSTKSTGSTQRNPPPVPPKKPVAKK